MKITKCFPLEFKECYLFLHNSVPAKGKCPHILIKVPAEDKCPHFLILSTCKK